MDRVRFSWTLGSLILMLSAWATSAASPLPGLNRLKRVEADPNQSYELTENHGPWMIFAASFAGDGAQKDAHRLVLELRGQYKLPAYTHKKHYDFSKSVTGNGLNQYLEPKRMKYVRSYEYDEVAVLVGDFASVSEPAVAGALELLKHAQPKALQIGNEENTTLRYAGLRAVQRRLAGDKTKKRQGPMSKAFVTRNPILPAEYFVPRGLDQFVMSMNKGVRHSLLTCRGKYSVRVATFRGSVIIDQNKIQAISKGSRSMKSRLDMAADRAHRLTEALRAQGVEAYEFHDRHESIVTVGSFASAGEPRNDGKIEINPSVLRIMEAYGPRRQQLSNGGAEQLAGLHPRSLGGISFDVQPMPVHVPRRSIAADYSRSKLF